MMDVYGLDLSDKDVICSDGSNVGQMHNILLDPKTGELEALTVSPTEDGASVAFSRTEKNRYRIPATAVTAVDDCVVIDA